VYGEVWWGGGYLDDTIMVEHEGGQYAYNSIMRVPEHVGEDPWGPNIIAGALRGVNGNLYNGGPLTVTEAEFSTLLGVILNSFSISGGDPTNIIWAP